MNKFVKIKCDLQGVYPYWFLVFDGNNKQEIIEPMNEKLIRTCFSLHGEASNNWAYRLIQSSCREINYKAIQEELNKILYIRANGVYMTQSSSDNIIEETYSDHFPVTEVADIVICENDKKEEYKWLEYLKGRFPTKTIKTINFFDLRTEKDILANFEGAEFITFSTTFSKMDWFEKLLRCKEKDQKIIGYCHDPKKWELISTDIEIVKSI